MSEKTHFRVRSALMMKPEYVKERHADGSFTPTNEFLEMLYEKDAELREPILTFITDKVGENWAVWFTAFTDEKFDVRIYCDSSEDYEQIVNEIRNRISKDKLNDFIPSGKVSDIDSQW